ncbi:MAG: hypothetical protein QXL17_06480 [Candidatus Thermoplasmatota archaeon]
MDVVNSQNKIYNEFGLIRQNILKKVVTIKNNVRDEFIHGGHLLSLNGPTMVLSIMIRFRLPIRFELFGMMYFFTLCVYNFDHYRDLEIDASGNNARSSYLKKHKNLLPYMIVLYGGIFTMLLTLFGTSVSILSGIVYLFLALLYSVKLKSLTKKITGFKNYYTSFCVGLLIFL